MTGYRATWRPGDRPEVAGTTQFESGHLSGVLTGYLVDAAGGSLDAGEVGGRWRRRGLDALEDLYGDFTVMVWDGERRCGLVAHDRMGAGGIYYRADGAGLTFATEVRDLLELLPVRPNPDPVSLTHWLARQAVPAGRTMYEGIYRLRPGEAIELGSAGWRLSRHWTPGFAGETDEDAVLAELTGAVRRRVGGGTVGVLLSGGLDSSTVGSLAAVETRPERLRAYSAVFPETPSVDESEYIGQTVESLDASWSTLVSSRGRAVTDGLEFIDRWEEPCPVPNFGLWRPLLRAAHAEGTRVILDGEGGDELFAPAWYLIADHVRRGRIRRARDLARALHRDAPARAVLRGVGLKGAAPRRLHGLGRRLRGSRLAPGFLVEASAALFDATFDPWSWKRGSGPLWRRHRTWFLVEQREEARALDYFRRAGADAGIDLRHPLLDADLADAILGLAPQTTFTDPPRGLQRRAMEGLAPDAVRLREGKSAFTEPVNATLAGPEFEALEGLLGSGAELEAYVRRGAIDELLARRPGRERWTLDYGWPGQAWRWAMAEAWLREQRTPGSAARLAVDLRSRPPVQEVVNRRAT